MRRSVNSLLCLLTVTATAAVANPKPIDFRIQILPPLKANCATCHGQARTSGFSVLTAADLFKGGDKAGPAVVAGHGKESPIVQYLRGERTPQMPMGGKTPAGLADLLQRWIDGGALVDGKPFHAAAQASILPPLPDGWPFVKPVKTAPPHVKDTGWVRNPIDAFVLAGLESHGLRPAPEASRPELIRRATFDLTGLPPTPEEVDQFVADKFPNAYEKLIDRLLNSPRYGERWGRHWLDLARYADTDGYERDDERKNAWRYRDYVIRSLNDDKPYNRFVEEQVAGDELWPGDPDALIATAFLRNGPWDSFAFDKKAQRNDFLTDVTDTTGSVFVGLTIGCARCHNHKYDPISQKDYYRFQSFFAAIQPADVPLPGAPPSTAPTAKTEATKTDVPAAFAIREEGSAAPKHYLLVRGDVYHPGDEVTPGFPSALAPNNSDAVVTAPAGGKTTGRRSALARWLASPDNPQTARVMVNRVWQYHFGEGIVGTPSDFGKNGERPSNPQLLDWLSSVFMAPDAAPSEPNCGWRLKKLHRLMMTSSAYRQSTEGEAAGAKLDPDNRLLWRMNRQRLEGEEIRDAILAVSGRLNLEMGGPGVYPEVEKGVLDTGSTHKWGDSPPAERLRRTIYVFQRRSVVLPLVDVFDGADSSGSCPRRAVTTIAPQALVLFNSQFTHEEAHYLAERVVREAGAAPAAEVDRLYRITLGRSPHPAELQECLDFLVRQTGIHQKEHQPAAGPTLVSATVPARDAAVSLAIDDLCHVLINTNEFVYLE